MWCLFVVVVVVVICLSGWLFFGFVLFCGGFFPSFGRSSLDLQEQFLFVSMQF